MRLPDTFRAPRPGMPLVFGHRGAAAYEPENTLRSFARALADGADGIECDVHRCASGELVVMHDPTLTRVAHDPRRVNDLALSELRSIDVGLGERIPLLDEVLDLVRAADRLVNVEVKADFDDRPLLARTVADAVARRSAHDQQGLLLSTFHPQLHALLAGALPATPIALLFDDDRRGRAVGLLGPTLLKPACVNPRHTLVTETRVARWHAEDRGVHTWTVDDPDVARRVATFGVDAIITNTPKEMRAALTGSLTYPSSG